MAALYGMLQRLYHDAKCAAENPEDAPRHHDSMVARAMHIAGRYKDVGCPFGTTLANAAPNLFTFLLHPRVDPTNNESERMLRRAVIHRKIRQRLVTMEGMEMFGTLFTCMATWEKRRLDPRRAAAEKAGRVDLTSYCITLPYIYELMAAWNTHENCYRHRHIRN